MWDTLGTNRQNVTKDITKYTIDSSGQTRNFHGRNREEQAILHDHHQELQTRKGRPQYRYVAGKLVKLVLQQEEEKHSSSSSFSTMSNNDNEKPSSSTTSATTTTTTAKDLTPDNIQEFYDAHSILVIDYFAPWCLWCQRLSPTWDKFADEIQQQQQQRQQQRQHHHSGMKVGVGKVDCVEHAQYCKEERIMAFPTIRWYQKGGKAIVPDYRGDRTVEAFMEDAKRRTRGKTDGGDGDGQDGDNDAAAAAAAADDDEEEEEHHPGCQLSGHLLVNRVPGTLIIEAKSINHDIYSAMMNMTHRVHHLSFGPPLLPEDDQWWGFLFGNWRRRRRRRSDVVLENYKRATNPMKEKYYPTHHPHEAYHHWLKVVGTHVYPNNGNRMFSLHEDDIFMYQILEESQLILYNEQSSPEIKFVFDLSPMGLKISRGGIPWYEYLTNLLAIIGGTYTTLGLINATLLRIFKPKRNDDGAWTIAWIYRLCSS